MTTNTQIRELADAASENEEYYLFSHGLYFRPGAAGYTGIRDNAGLFTKSYAENYCRTGAVTMLHMSDPKALEFMPDTYTDLIIKHLKAKKDATLQQLDEKDARVKELEEALWWYADLAQYEGISLGVAPLNEDRGQRAREALKGAAT